MAVSSIQLWKQSLCDTKEIKIYKKESAKSRKIFEALLDISVLTAMSITILTR